MFEEAVRYLRQALDYTQRQNQDFYAIRESLESALVAVNSDLRKPVHLRDQAIEAIQRAISYTYSRTNPAFTAQNFQSMTSTPISPFQQSTPIGPYGLLQTPLFPSQPNIVPTAWTNKARETNTLALLIRNALYIVRSGIN